MIILRDLLNQVAGLREDIIPGQAMAALEEAVRKVAQDTRLLRDITFTTFPAGAAAIEIPVPPSRDLVRVEVVEYRDSNGQWRRVRRVAPFYIEGMDLAPDTSASPRDPAAWGRRGTTLFFPDPADLDYPLRVTYAWAPRRVPRAIPAPAPSPPFAISVAPLYSKLEFDDTGNQLGPLVLDVVITRYNGYAEPIDIYSTAFTAIDYFDGKVNGQWFSGLTDHILPACTDDHFTITFSVGLPDFLQVADLWLDNFLHGTGADGKTADSNHFAVVDPEPDHPYLKIAVTPASQPPNYESPMAAVNFDVTITRMNGFSGPITATLPRVRSFPNEADPSERIIVTMNGVDAPVDESGDISPATNLVVEDVPDTFQVVIAGGHSVVLDPGVGSMQILAAGEDGVSYFSNVFRLLLE